MHRSILFLFLVVSLVLGCVNKTPTINGVSFVASQNKIMQEHVDPIVELNANHASIMPFGFIQDLHHPEIKYNTSRQWFGETREGAKQYIELLFQNNIYRLDRNENRRRLESV